MCYEDSLNGLIFLKMMLLGRIRLSFCLNFHLLCILGNNKVLMGRELSHFIGEGISVREGGHQLVTLLLQQHFSVTSSYNSSPAAILAREESCVSYFKIVMKQSLSISLSLSLPVLHLLNLISFFLSPNSILSALSLFSSISSLNPSFSSSILCQGS